MTSTSCRSAAQWLTSPQLHSPDICELRSWGNVMNGQERRRIQNRVNQQCRRSRKLEEDREAGIVRRARGRPRIYNKRVAASRNSMSHQQSSQSYLSSVIRNSIDDVTDAPDVHDLCGLSLAAMIARQNRLATLVWSGDPASGLLLSLAQLNSWRAMMHNMNAVGLTMETVKREDAISCFNVHEFDPAVAERQIPPPLRPTSLQRASRHHPWIDPFPFPELRDALLLWEGTYSEESFCNDFCGVCDTGSGTGGSGGHGQVGMLTWGEPWDPSGWEMTEEFATKWLWMFAQCSELLAATNRWRVMRGETELFGWLAGVPYIKKAVIPSD